MPRLTRKEKQERTRSSLLSSAAKLFCWKGLERASIDEVAEDAGYTKGAFYANFKSKEELFLAMLDERFEERIREIGAAFADEESPPDQARHAAADWARSLHADEEGTRLFLQFYVYALRNPEFRQELLTRFATLRNRLEAVYRRRAEETGVTPPVGMERIVWMVIAMADGWALWNQLEPGEADDELLEEMFAIFTTGIGAMAGVFERQDSSAG